MDLLRMDRHTAMLEIFVGDWIANFRSSLTADLQLSYLVRFVPIAEHANAGVQVLTHFLLHFHPVIL
ncbi:hypothetical protein DL121_17285 [Salmonella enterica subsp. enterica]|nr:hypothetical protein [Salmonella enterica subsp. enterica]